MKEKIILAVVGFVGLVVVVGLLMTIPVWLLWNAVMPDIFGVPAISFWQAMGVSFLSSCLFKSSSSTSK